MNRTVRGMLVALAIGGGMTIAGRGRAATPPCTIATRGSSPVAQACAEGGLVSAKRTMRELMKRAKAAGTKFECDECHRNDTGYDLTPQARDSFRKLLSAANDGRP